MTQEEISRKIFSERGISTDKNGLLPTDAHHNYLVCYERYVSSIRDSVKKVLELGIGEGASLIMEAEYFPNCHVHGIDNDPLNINSVLNVIDVNRISIYNCNYNDNGAFSRTMSSIGGDIDIVIDDGDHSFGAQLNAMSRLAPYLRQGGLYFLEDVHVAHGLEKCKNHASSCGLEVLEDYCDLEYLNRNYNEYHMLIMRRR